MPRFKVLLINPPYFFNNTATRATQAAMLGKPPLSVVHLATYLNKYSDFETRVIDAEVAGLTEEEISEKIADFDPDVVGITVVSFKLYPAHRVAQIAKSLNKKVHVCMGGPHVAIYPKETLGLDGVDSIVLGDGEVPFLELCKRLCSGGNINGIYGCYTKDTIPRDDVFHKYINEHLDELPMPDLTTLPDYRRHYRTFLTNEVMTTAVTSKGCPHRCIFCQLDRSIRMKSIERVIDEISLFLGLGIKEIEFYDETFNVTVKRTMDFANAVLKRGLKFNWSFRGRVNAVSMEMLEAIKDAGCQRIQYGVEAGTDKVLKTIKKDTTVEQIRRCFELTRRAGIETVAYFMLGNPGETEDDILKTIQFAKEIRPDYVNFCIFKLVPGVEAYTLALKQGIVDRDYWLEFASNPRPSLPVLYWDREVSRGRLEELNRLAVRRFYLRPSYILDRLRKTSLSNLPGTIRAGYYVLSE